MELMSKKAWIIAFSILFSIFLLFALIQVSTHKKISVTDISISQLEISDSDAIKMNGIITVENKGVIPLFFYDVAYSIHLSDKYDLGKGTINGRTIKSRRTTHLPFTITTISSPKFDSIVSVLSKGDSDLIIKGKIRVLSISTFSINFEKRYPARKTLKDLLVIIVDSAINKTKDPLIKTVKSSVIEYLNTV